MPNRIYIVEDNRFYGDLLKNELEKDNLGKVKVFTSGETFLNYMDTNPDIIILDHNLGSMKGVDLLQQVKITNPQVEVIFLSSQEQMNVAVKSLKFGAYDYVEKNNHAFDKVKQNVRIINQKLADKRKKQNIKIAKILVVIFILFALITYYFITP
jgi:DNA-binding response OmpR family regulator